MTHGRGAGSLLRLHLPPLALVLQLFSEVQERAIEEQMVAVKDVVMEPTMKTLSDDLVRSRCRPGPGAVHPVPWRRRASP